MRQRDLNFRDRSANETAGQSSGPKSDRETHWNSSQLEDGHIDHGVHRIFPFPLTATVQDVIAVFAFHLSIETHSQALREGLGISCVLASVETVPALTSSAGSVRRRCFDIGLAGGKTAGPTGTFTPADPSTGPPSSPGRTRVSLSKLLRCAWLAGGIPASGRCIWRPLRSIRCRAGPIPWARRWCW